MVQIYVDQIETKMKIGKYIVVVFFYNSDNQIELNVQTIKKAQT